MRVACIQMTSSDDVAANIRRIDGLAREAAGAGAQLIALPENALRMLPPGSKGEADYWRQDVHPGIPAMQALAAQHGCYLLVGSVAVLADDTGKAVNRSLMIDPKGRIMAQYDKIHLFDVTLPHGETYAESARIQPGSQAVTVALPDMTLGMSICYDVRFPHLYRALAQAGAGVLAVPAAFTEPTGKAHWHVLLRARAIENGAYVIAPAQCGVHPGGRKTYGHALIIDPWGEILADAGEEEGIISADLDPARIAHVRNMLPSLRHDRQFSLLNG